MTELSGPPRHQSPRMEQGGAPMRSRGRRIARAALFTLAGLAFFVGMYALIVWLLRPQIGGALLGPVGPIVAFLVGAIAFFSPCVLPLVPGYLSFVSGLSGEEMDAPHARRRVLLGVGLFILGFSIMFTLMGLALTTVGITLLGNLENLTRIGGVIVILMGLGFALPSLLPFFQRERRPLLTRVKPGIAGALPLGGAFAVGWSPCVGPGMGVIITLGYSEGSTARAAVLYFFFCLGFGMWFVLSALGMRKALVASGWIRSHARTLQAVGGGFMIAIGALLVTNTWDVVIGPLRELTDRFATPL